MLILTRRRDEKIMMGDGANLITITVIELAHGKVRLGFEANSGLKIYREEIYNQIHQGEKHAQGGEAGQQADQQDLQQGVGG